jgi:hypothetical protein
MTVTETAPDHHVARHTIEVADQTLAFRSLQIDDLTPTGAQISEVAGFKPAQQVTVLHILADGELEDIRPTETVDLCTGENRFIVVETDRSYRLTVDGERFDWPCRMISGGVIRKLASVPPEDQILFEHSDSADRVVENKDLIDLDLPGVEAFITRKRTWKLNVQGVVLTVPTPTIIVRTALVEAGFNPDLGWQIFLIVKGQPKRAVTLTEPIDLRTPGIEKLRLTPAGVHNGEAMALPKRDFDVLDVDEAYLNSLGYHWETVKDGDGRWLLIHNYPVPAGYTSRSVVLALLIPPTYPGAQIDMFYTNPPLKLVSGRAIDRTQPKAVIRGAEFNGWSRHRPWNPAVDNVVTQLALVESAIAKEIGE